MALILTDRLKKEYGSLLEAASAFYVDVLTSYLSEAYDLLDGDEIKGEIILVKDNFKQYPELEGKEITLILKRSIIFDTLYISKSDWQQHFREWGIVSAGYTVQLRLTEALSKMTNKSEKLYTKQDVSLGLFLA